MKKLLLGFSIILLIAIAFLHQNCSDDGEGLNSKSSKSLGKLDLQFRYSAMSVPVGTTTLSLDGQCAVGSYPRNRIIWQSSIGGRLVNGYADNACNSVSHFFFLNINLAPYTLPVNSNFVVVATMVGIDSKGRMVSGGSRSISITMVNGPGGGTGTGDDPPPGGTPPPDICTPGASQKLGDIHDAMTISGNAVIADYEETSEISDVTLNGNGDICIYHSKLGQWPVTYPLDASTAVEGNYWFISYLGGAWVIWPFDWYRPGQACKSISMTNTGLDSGVGGAITAVTYWTPCSGALVGVVASTPGRTGVVGPVQERSDIFWIYWP